MVIAAMKLKDTCSLEEVMTNIDSILKSRDITLPTKVHLVKAMVFPVFSCFLFLPLLSNPCTLMSILSVKFGLISFFLCVLSVIDFGLWLT